MNAVNDLTGSQTAALAQHQFTRDIKLTNESKWQIIA
jgi:hypothetical protein